MSGEEFDFVIVGSGAGSVPAALLMAQHGRTALIVEKQARIGGSTAFSGGTLWIPDNDHLNAGDDPDTPERARTYFADVVGDAGLASSQARRDAFIRNGTRMIRFLEDQGMIFVHAHWPDYYDSRPGGVAEGRSLNVPLFDIRELGEWQSRLAAHPLTASTPLSSHESNALFVAKKTWAGRKVAAKLVYRLIGNKLLGRKLRGTGNALQGRLFQIALRRNIPIWTESPVTDFLVENGRVVGVVVDREGSTETVRARLGVLINAGGFSHNVAMRRQYQPQLPPGPDWSQSNPGDTGEMIEAARRLGAATDLMDQAWWLPSSFDPDGSFHSFHAPNDTGKPHSITVNRHGKRFVNESCSYMEFGQAQLANDAVPAWTILESRHRNTYPWGKLLPGLTPASAVKSGYILKANTLEDLAYQCGIGSAALIETVARFNQFARCGVDEDFGRGSSAYNAYYGDPTHGPNPCLGAIERPPFYAVKLVPGDVGTSGGLMTDEHARVLREDGSVIPGLYATGNSTASIMGRRYLGAGASIGPSMTFGYIAASHALGVNE